MNNEQQQIIDEAYENYESQQINMYIPIWSQEEFINKCKIDPEFSEKWGLNIEERVLSLEERNKWSWDNWGITCEMESVLDEQEVPTKLITITYNDKTIESYNTDRIK
jgi:hypothetical protein